MKVGEAGLRFLGMDVTEEDLASFAGNLNQLSLADLVGSRGEETWPASIAAAIESLKEGALGATAVSLADIQTHLIPLAAEPLKTVLPATPVFHTRP